jgi:hypothetical protein
MESGEGRKGSKKTIPNLRANAFFDNVNTPSGDDVKQTLIGNTADVPLSDGSQSTAPLDNITSQTVGESTALNNIMTCESEGPMSSTLPS